MRLHHLALRVEDCARSAEFYGGVLGLREIRRQTTGGAVRSIWFALGEAVLMVEQALRGRAPDADERGSAHVLALAVTDLQEWEERLARAGLAVIDRTPSTLFVSDPDGHRVGLSVYRF